MESETQAIRGAGRAPEIDRAARFGRRAGIAIYLAFLGYMAVVGFGTFIEGVFVDSAHADASVGGSCEDARRVLATSLRTRAAAHVGGDVASTTSFFESFDDRLESLRTRCDDPETARLERARYRVEITLHRFDRENAPTFERLGAAPSSPSHEETPR